ncbi:CYTH domain-containing protein [Halalkalibacter nanhaiisediminis]|uniref:Uncharacterized protein YjbK n=1 Tax=Halalkalibacter nanhaiisediminis TaxID=688079 RepID=A0A562QB92_9BACI|nr:CYTH domain-containing protein [Halalkalibacter nanhaiisediminis]TWI53286.1 uncharacterized protein YjbK [Halalkalibacter nanhaiisediminis]
MVQEIEIEAKSMVAEQGYHILLKGFNLKETDAVTQHNHYFETPNFSLKEKGSALRIREKNAIYTLTLKQPHNVGKLETHQTISEAEWQEAMANHQLPLGNVYRQLESLNIPITQLQYVGCLMTSRIEMNYNNGILCFDKSHYFDQIDYEIEFEGTNELHAQNTLLTLLAEYDLSPLPTENKVRRFFRRKHEIVK